MTDEQKQKMVDSWRDTTIGDHHLLPDVIEEVYDARDEEVKVLREALNEASELVEALMMDNRGKVYEQAQDFLQAKLQQFIDAHQALERTSKKEV